MAHLTHLHVQCWYLWHQDHFWTCPHFISYICLIYNWSSITTHNLSFLDHRLVSTSFSSSELYSFDTVKLFTHFRSIILLPVVCMHLTMYCLLFTLYTCMKQSQFQFHNVLSCQSSLVSFMHVYNDLTSAYVHDLNRTSHGMDIIYTIFQIKIKHLVIYKLFILQ